MIIVATGSRFATHDDHGVTIRKGLMWAIRWSLIEPDGHKHRLWQGGARGADAITRSAAIEYLWDDQTFPADWPTCDPAWSDPMTNVSPCRRRGHRKTRWDGVEYCPFAGHRRNQEMIDAALLHAEETKVCAAFPMPERGSSGTADCMNRAWRFGIPVVTVPLSPA